MTRQFDGKTLLIASHNKGKTHEIATLLAGYVENFPNSGDLGLPEPEETGETFVANATLKAVAAAKASGHIALADDSGLGLYALNGQPGVYTARWTLQADGSRDYAHMVERINTELNGNPDRSAVCICALALAWPDGHCETVEGRLEGKLITTPRGDKGFGFSPWFVPQGDTRTLGEINLEETLKINHRSNAFRLMIAKCFS